MGWNPTGSAVDDDPRGRTTVGHPTGSPRALETACRIVQELGSCPWSESSPSRRPPRSTLRTHWSHSGQIDRVARPRSVGLRAEGMMALRSKARVVAGWALQVLMAIAFVSIGLGKLHDPSWAQSFERWGYPPGFHRVTGVIEAACGVLLLVPRLTSHAALALSAVMIGAVATHAMAGQPWTRPLPHLTMLLILAWLRWPRRLRRVSAPAGAPVRS